MSSTSKVINPGGSNFRPSDTPPSSPSPADDMVTSWQPYSGPPDVLNLTELFKEMVVAITRSTEASQDSTPTSHPGDAHITGNTQPEDSKGRASKLEYKTVEEVWDASTHKYKIVEHSAQIPESSGLDEYVFVVRVRVDKSTEDLTHYINVNSEALRDILRTVLRNINGVSLKEDKPAIERNILFHYLADLETYRNTRANDTPCLDHLVLLVDYIKTTYASAAERLAPLLASREITFDLLWALFRPNSVVYTTCFGTGAPRCIKFDIGEERVTKQRVRYFHIEGRYLDFDGKVFGESRVVVPLEKFRGAKQLHLLEAFPLEYHPNQDAIKDYLIECGKTFVSLMGVHHRHFEGTAFHMHNREPVQVSVKSRVTIDATFFRHINPNYVKPGVDKPTIQQSNFISFDVWSIAALISDQPDNVQNNGIDATDLDEDGLLVCSPTVLGFSYTDKMWLEFAVGGIRDIKWNTSSFDSLVLPETQRDVVLALAETYMGTQATPPFDDIVEGKGQGLNMLLHGPPGVGKTLTAEVLSEYLQKPLYSISAGELSTEAKKLEDRLCTIFQLGSRWNALLLLDEADVFLEQRTTENIVRHGLVSVFLRKLEYFRGILVLTTNRVHNFDDAILSRIHLKIKYGNLDAEARRKVWKIFVEKANIPHGESNICGKELEQLVRKELNGRQIKNTITTARALANQRKAQLSFAHLKAVIDAGEMFDRDFHRADRSEHLFL